MGIKSKRLKAGWDESTDCWFKLAELVIYNPFALDKSLTLIHISTTMQNSISCL